MVVGWPQDFAFQKYGMLRVEDYHQAHRVNHTASTQKHALCEGERQPNNLEKQYYETQKGHPLYNDTYTVYI